MLKMFKFWDLFRFEILNEYDIHNLYSGIIKKENNLVIFQTPMNLEDIVLSAQDTEKYRLSIYIHASILRQKGKRYSY